MVISVSREQYHIWSHRKASGALTSLKTFLRTWTVHRGIAEVVSCKSFPPISFWSLSLLERRLKNFAVLINVKWRSQRTFSISDSILQNSSPCGLNRSPRRMSSCLFPGFIFLLEFDYDSLLTMCLCLMNCFSVFNLNFITVLLVSPFLSSHLCKLFVSSHLRVMTKSLCISIAFRALLCDISSLASSVLCFTITSFFIKMIAVPFLHHLAVFPAIRAPLLVVSCFTTNPFVAISAKPGSCFPMVRESQKTLSINMVASSTFFFNFSTSRNPLQNCRCPTLIINSMTPMGHIPTLSQIETPVSAVVGLFCHAAVGMHYWLDLAPHVS